MSNNSSSFCQSEPTDELCLVIYFLNEMGFSNLQIANRYGLNKNTLGQIAKGVHIIKSHNKYRLQFFLALCDARIQSMNSGGFVRNEEKRFSTEDITLMIICMARMVMEGESGGTGPSDTLVSLHI